MTGDVTRPGRRGLRRRPVRVAAACLLSALLVPLAVLPQLSARVTGEEYRFAVEPLDPVDPFRGAYVALAYPGIGRPEVQRGAPREGTLYVPLRRVPGSDLWEGAATVERRPARGPYLRCEGDWRLRCGIETLFASQERALPLERELADGAVAVVRIDRRGSAAVVDVVDG